jgi:hypothetical protein
MPCPYNVILGRDTALPWTHYHVLYNVILGRDTALPWTHYHVLGIIKSAIGIEITCRSKIYLNWVYLPKFP